MPKQKLSEIYELLKIHINFFEYFAFFESLKVERALSAKYLCRNSAMHLPEFVAAKFHILVIFL